MKTQNRLITTAVLVIFVLCHILPLHNAISHCVDSNVYKTVDDLDDLYKDRYEIYRKAKDKLADAENTKLSDFLKEYAAKGAGVGVGTAAVGGALTGGIGLIPALLLGGITGYTAGLATGTFAYYKAIDDAKEALKTAQDELDHAAAKLEQAKQRQAREAIQPQELQISVYQPHTINISTGKPIKNVSVSIAPEDPMNPNGPINLDTGNFSSNVYSTTMSYSFSASDKGLHNVWVTIYLTDETTIYRYYQILVTD